MVQWCGLGSGCWGDSFVKKLSEISFGLPSTTRELFKVLTLLLCPFLSCCSRSCALPCTSLMKILILQLDFLAWPQPCLTTATCLTITGMCCPHLLPPDLLCSTVWLLWDCVSGEDTVPACCMAPLSLWLALSDSLLNIEIQNPIYRTAFLCCSSWQRDGFQLLKSSYILEFVRHIWKSETKNILILKIPSLETVLPFLHDGYLSFYSLSFDISCSVLKSLFEISHSWGLPKVCSILQVVAHFLWPPDNAFYHSYHCEMPILPLLFFHHAITFVKNH